MKIERTTILVFVVVTFISGLFTNANANLIVNGSFEVGPDPGPALYITLNPEATAITGWTVTREGIDYKGTFWQASDGVISLDLDSSPGFGGVMQTFATTPGVQYLATFDMAGNPYLGLGDPVDKHMRVAAAGQSADYSFDVTGHDFQNMGWETNSWWFTASGSSTTIEFYSLHDEYGGYSGAVGPTLDNVSVSMLVSPEPTTLSLLGLGGFLLRRRKK